MINIFSSTANIIIHNIQAICYCLQFVSLFDALHHQTWFIQNEQTGIKLSIVLILRLTVMFFSLCPAIRGELGHEDNPRPPVLTMAVFLKIKTKKLKITNLFFTNDNLCTNDFFSVKCVRRLLWALYSQTFPIITVDLSYGCSA